MSSLARGLNGARRTSLPDHLSRRNRGTAGKIKKVNSPPRGAIAQLGERIVRNDEVVGSSPTSSTNLLNDLATFAATFANIEEPALLDRFGP